MPNDAYRLDGYTTLSLSTPSGSEEFVAGIQGATITPMFDYTDLNTADSIIREATMRTNAQVQVELNWSLFNVELVRANIGAPGSPGSTINDTSAVPLFALEFEVDSEGGDRTLGPVTVEGMRFDDDPPLFDGTQGEWVEWSGTMIGKNVSSLSVTDNTTA